MPPKSRLFDSAEYLDTAEGVEAYLADAYRGGDQAQIDRALAVVDRARGMTELGAEFLAEARRQSLAVADSPHVAEDQAFIDAASAGQLE